MCEPVTGAAERDAVRAHVFASVPVGDKMVNDEPIDVAAVGAAVAVTLLHILA